MSGPAPSSAVTEIDVGSSSSESGEAARDAADEAVDEATASHQAAEGTSSTSSLSSRNGLKNALLRTQPNTRLEDVESPWDPERGGMNRMYRGMQKMLDFEGMPAVVDLVVGAGEFVARFEPESSESADAGDQEANDDLGNPMEELA